LIEVGGHLHDSLWRSAWDFVFAASNLLLAILFGAALGNVIRGVPIDERGTFTMSLFSDFRTSGRVGLLDWYTLSVAVFVTVIAVAVWALWTGLRGSAEGRAFAGSCAMIVSLLAGAAVSLVPVVLLPTLGAEHSMTAYTGATAERGLTIALIWWPIAVAFALTYFFVIMRIYAGKVRPAQDTRGVLAQLARRGPVSDR
jgi:cytochrome bd-type quinol oxidase subunit 2